MIKRLTAVLVASASLTLLSTAAFAQQLPQPSYGVNLGNTFEPPCGVGCWGPPMPTQTGINAMANAGFNTLRIPVSWLSHANSSGTIDSGFMSQVTSVVNWALAKNMYVVVNEHWDNGWFDSNGFGSYDSNINSKLQNLWTQVANNFKNTSTHLLFACTNEPDVSSQAGTNVLFQYYRNWVTTIRNTGGNNATRWLILQAPGPSIDKASSYINSSIWPSDKSLELECHAYDPFQFTQLTGDASWGAMYYFWGAQYHVSNPANRNAAWGEESYVDAENAKAQTNFVNKGIPVFIGEWRAVAKPSEPDLTGTNITQNYNSATYWNYYMQHSNASHGLTGTCWQTDDIIDQVTGAIKNQDALNAVLGRSYIPPVGSGSISNGNHTLTPQNATGSRLDANGSGTSNGTKVQIWGSSGSANQSWKFTNQTGSIYTISPSYATGLCLDVNGNSSANGAIVQLWGCSGSNNQKWGAISDGGNVYEFAPQNATGSRLDVTGSSSTNGTQVEIWSASGGSNQKWAVN